MYVYYLSKIPELFDTAILALKKVPIHVAHTRLPYLYMKKPIIFLHWYHHSIVILMVWSWIQDVSTFAAYGMLANCFIHIWMYAYYGMSSLGMNVWFKVSSVVLLPK